VAARWGFQLPLGSRRAAKHAPTSMNEQTEAIAAIIAILFDSDINVSLTCTARVADYA
jgi:hypothetical protein